VTHTNKMMVLLLCAMHSTQGMEVWGETKSEKTVLNREKYSNYNSLPNSSAVSSEEREYLKAFLKASAQALPPDIKACIATKLVQLYFLTALKCIEEKPLEVLNLVCQVQSICPLTIGEKTFEWKDLIVLKKKKQESLFNLGNPSTCWKCFTGLDNITVPGSCSNVDYAIKAGVAKLQCRDVPAARAISCYSMDNDLDDMPAHIKKNLIIQESECCTPILFGCCAPLALSGSLLGLASLIFSSSCSSTAIAGGGLMVPGCTWCVAARTGACNRYCVSRYSVDEGKYL